MPSSSDTSSRILEAAVREFAQHGLAGARIDRIAAVANANVRSIYAHFGNKEELFFAALNTALDGMAASVPLVDSDLPEWAGRLFDYHLAHPEALRIALWRQLERPEHGHSSTHAYVERVRAMSAIDEVTAETVDTLVFIFALAQSWYLSPTVLLSADGSDPGSPERLRDHRRALVAAAAAVCARTSIRTDATR
ncbi:TetR/AcrR family transcriptional regulator [Microbacterium sp. RD1]|uniref:TetR/AcrR family transcriptional regulator n=1 Tax=Microbacterium sp. RD1 TaxID=3457313 RepID=UPI003FA605F1